MSFVAAAVIVGGATLAGAYMSSQGAKSAAGQYTDAANRGLAQNQQMFDTINEQNAPYRKLGESGAKTYQDLLDSGYLTANPSMNDLTRLMPNYEFGLKQGLGQFNAGLNAGGGAVSGNAIQGGQQFAQDYAQNSLLNAFNMYQTNRSNVASLIGAPVGWGLNANQTTASAGTGASSNASNLLSSIGNANAQATMAGANAWSSGLNNISQYAMLYGLKNMPAGGGAGSDIRMKENIKEIGSLPNGLSVYSFEYKPEFKDDKYCGHGRYAGLMAHEVEKMIPDAVITRADGYKMIDYAKV